MSDREPAPPADPAGISADDLYLFNEGTQLRLYEQLGAHPVPAGEDRAAGTRFAVWAPNARSVAVIGDWNGWDRGAHPLAARGASGIWEGFVPGVGPGAHYKYHLASRYRGYRVDKADPLRLPCRDAAAPGFDRLGPRLRLGRRGVDGGARRPPDARRADVDLRGAPGILAAGAGGGQPVAELPRGRAQARRPRRPAGLHPRRADAGDGASVLRLVGLSGHRLLRAHQPLRHAAGPDVPDRSPAPARHRGDPRLGAVAFPERRARPGVLRRHAPLRARRSRARASSRTGGA